jgi:broad specificity phosphatase PhoE
LSLDVSKIITEKCIMEYDIGSLSGIPWQKNFSDPYIEIENAEDPKMFCKRVCSCVEELSKLPENILLVSHSGVGRILEAVKEDIDIELFYKLPVYKNGSITKIDWIGSKEQTLQ